MQPYLMENRSILANFDEYGAPLHFPYRKLIYLTYLSTNHFSQSLRNSFGMLKMICNQFGINQGSTQVVNGLMCFWRGKCPITACLTLDKVRSEEAD